MLNHQQTNYSIFLASLIRTQAHPHSTTHDVEVVARCTSTLAVN
ncbi:hypothetical protein V12B01_12620 [Vibrio splendidus 12B01]|nr:hypothetical protein V12B01_12620 [Vibrio splendidus 12B01]